MKPLPQSHRGTTPHRLGTPSFAISQARLSRARMRIVKGEGAELRIRKNTDGSRDYRLAS